MVTQSLPDATGHFDQFGGKFVPEALYAALDAAGGGVPGRPGRPGVRRRAERAAGRLHRPAEPDHRGAAVRRARGRRSGAPTIVLKREDLNHTGSHKINNVLGQALLTRRMGKTRVIAETGAGQHGVATATAAALFGLDCTVYMGKVDTERQALNVARMRLLGAEVIAVESGTQTLKDAMNDAMRDWVASVDHTHYLIGTVAGPHPFPMLVREFQRVISTEARAQLLEPLRPAARRGRGLRRRRLERARHLRRLHPRRRGRAVRLRGRRRRRRDRPARRHHLRRLGRGAARHADLRAAGRGRPDQGVALDLGRSGLPRRRARALLAGRRPAAATTSRSPTPRRWRRFRLLSRTEGIVPAIESAHALAGALKLGRRLPPAADGTPPLILVNLSGRGDKDVDTAIKWFDLDTSGTARAPRTSDRRERWPVDRPVRASIRAATGAAVRRRPGHGRGALVGFLHVGYPDVATSLQALPAL